MASEHSLLRSSIDSVDEAKRILDKYNKRDKDFKMTPEDLHSLRTAASMAHQSARSLSELTGYLEAKFYAK